MNDIYDVLEHVLYANKEATSKKIQEIMFMTYGYSYEDTRRAQEALARPIYWVDKPNGIPVTNIRTPPPTPVPPQCQQQKEIPRHGAGVDKSSGAGENYWVDKASLNNASAQDWDAVRPDMVNSPPHYTKGGIETIDFIQAKLSPEEYRGYLRGNLLKYASRLGEKDSDDAGKAAWYAQRLEML